MDLVFVYGSLKRGHYNHSLLLNAEFLSAHVTERKYTMVNLGAYPAVLMQGNTPISGEVYRVSRIELSSLDKLEGYPDYYNRVLIPTQFGEAHMYVLLENIDGNPIIYSGVWE